MSYRPKHLDRGKGAPRTGLESQRSGEQTLRRNRNVSFAGMVGGGGCLKEGSSNQAIIERLEKHIQYLEKKLTTAETDVNRLADLVADLQHRLSLKDNELSALAGRLSQEQRFNEDLLRKYEGDEGTGRGNGMQKLRSMSPDAEGKDQNRPKCKPGKFSAAFLPTGFNSPNRVKGHKAEAFGGLFKDSSCRYLHENDGKVGNLYNQDLMKQWKKEKRERAMKSKEAEELAAKNEILLKQVSSQKSLLTTLKHQASRTELRLNQEVSKLRKQSKFHSRHRDKLIQQLKLSEEQVSFLMQYAPEQDETFTTFDLKGLVERESSQFLMESGVSQFVFRPIASKQEVASQTEEVVTFVNQKMVGLEEKVRRIEEDLKESVRGCELAEERHRQECQEYETAIELYKLRIEQLDHTIEMSRSRGDGGEGVEQGVTCEIVPNYVCEERQEILEKVKVLLEVNEGLKEQVMTEESISHQLRQHIVDITSKKGQVVSQEVQISPTDDEFSLLPAKRSRLYSFGSDESHPNCDNCSQLASTLLSLQQQRNHYSNKYEQTLTALQYQQQDAEAELAKMHEAIMEKDVRLRKVVEEAEREQLEQREMIGVLRGKVRGMGGGGEGWEEIGSVFDG